MTHLACADERDGQRRRASSCGASGPHARAWPARRSIANSAGAPRLTAAPASDWVRPGLALYGVSPFADATAADLGLQPVMTLDQHGASRCGRCGAASAVGYGGAWSAPRDSRIAIIAAGYGDGVPRSFDDRHAGAHRRAAARRWSGRVSMDMIAVDVTELPGVERRRPRRCCGAQDLPVEEVARARGHDRLRTAVRRQPARAARAALKSPRRMIGGGAT